MFNVSTRLSVSLLNKFQGPKLLSLTTFSKSQPLPASSQYTNPCNWSTFHFFGHLPTFCPLMSRHTAARMTPSKMQTWSGHFLLINFRIFSFWSSHLLPTLLPSFSFSLSIQLSILLVLSFWRTLTMLFSPFAHSHEQFLKSLPSCLVKWRAKTI